MKIKKAPVVVRDEKGLPNYMTMFYMEPGTEPEENVPGMFEIKGKTVPAILISQFFNTILNDTPVSLPFQRPAERISFDRAAALCRKKGAGWHLLTNTEFVYLMHEAEALGHIIGGNTNYGANAKNPEEKGILFDKCNTLTGCDPVSWSHDGTPGGVFGLCGNYWEPVAGLRLHKGVIEYIKDNDAAAEDFTTDAPEWIAATVDGKMLKLGLQDGDVVLTDGAIESGWDGCHIKDLTLAGDLKDVPEIAHKLGIVPHDWQQETAGIWADSELEEAVPFRGSHFNDPSSGGVGALDLHNARSNASYSIGFRSALYLEDWKLITELLEAGAAAHA